MRERINEILLRIFLLTQNKEKSFIKILKIKIISMYMSYFYSANICIDKIVQTFNRLVLHYHQRLHNSAGRRSISVKLYNPDKVNMYNPDFDI